jgi:hypothetical protein
MTPDPAASQWRYVLIPLLSQDQTDPLSVRFELWHGDYCRATGVLDWECGVMLYHAETEPDQWSALAACALTALHAAKAMLGANWAAGGQRGPA